MTVEGFKKCRTSSAVDGTGDDMLWNGSDEGGNVGSKCEEDAGTDCEDKGTLIGKGRQNLTCFCVKCLQFIVIYFFLADISFL